MGIRDQEIHKLTLYAQSMGLKVEYKRHQRGDPGATWSTDYVLTMYTWPRQTKIGLLLNFLHELAHHIEFVYADRKHNPELLKALNLEADRKPGSTPIHKSYRKLIYEDELRAAGYREQIYNEVGLKFPVDILKRDIEQDLYGYFQYYKTGNYPTQKQVKANFKKGRK